MVRWEPAARAVLSQFRAAAAQQPDDPRFATIVAELTEASPEFRTWWAEYPNPDLLMVLQVPRSQDDLQRVMSLLDHL